ncbi:hypothetical protein PRIPAC_95728 [Pristionchus pacificus]|uniref:Uncharacterized protein n=1 Tax=Pristionchus pacificus TaxID=54126 RepID=A0A2A6BIS1_PRIPA|nr:hypothetical protein PRIPAC_95728 [Pristionchus pacificus]|eukprot:PDM65804.1 hypothetical protein PRIPAC_45205 [Pristionchus pacificus]
MPPIPSGPRPRSRAASERSEGHHQQPSRVSPAPPRLFYLPQRPLTSELDLTDTEITPFGPDTKVASIAGRPRAGSMDHGLGQNDRPIFKRRAVADWHLLVEFVWAIVWICADTKDNLQNQLIIAFTFVAGILTSRIMVFAIDCNRLLAHVAFLFMTLLWMPRLYPIYLVITYNSEVILTDSNPYYSSYLAIVAVLLLHLWINYEYSRAYSLISKEKEDARIAEEERVVSDKKWREKQKIRKLRMKRKQAEERARARREREAENGTLVNEDTPSTSTGQKSSNSHDHFYVERE